MSSDNQLPTQAEIAEKTREAIRNHRTLFLIQGIIMIILGLVAVAVPQIATIGVELVVGWLFVIGGIVRLVATFQSRGAPGFWWSVLTAILAIVVGVILLANPVAGVITLTMVLIAMFAIEGVFQIIAGFEYRRAAAGSWFWLILSGVVDLILAGLIIAGWPGTAAWAIGLLVGINLLFAGIALTMTAVAANSMPD